MVADWNLLFNKKRNVFAFKKMSTMADSNLLVTLLLLRLLLPSHLIFALKRTKNNGRLKSMVTVLLLSSHNTNFFIHSGIYSYIYKHMHVQRLTNQ